MKIKDLNKFKIFNDLSSKEIELFTNKLKTQLFNNHDVIMQEGEAGNALLFLLEGEIKITKALTLATNKNENNHDSREKEFIRCSSKDNIIIGEISLFSNDNKRTATVKAISKCNIGYLSKDDFFNICEENKDVGYKILNNLIKIITQRLINTNHQVLKLTTAFSLIIDN